LLRTR